MKLRFPRPMELWKYCPSNIEYPASPKHEAQPEKKKQSRVRMSRACKRLRIQELMRGVSLFEMSDTPRVDVVLERCRIDANTALSPSMAILIGELRDFERALRYADQAINPDDRGGISMHEWNERLKRATTVIREALA